MQLQRVATKFNIEKEKCQLTLLFFCRYETTAGRRLAGEPTGTVGGAGTPPRVGTRGAFALEKQRYFLSFPESILFIRAGISFSPFALM